LSIQRPNVERVFAAAAPLTARSRAALLDRECAGDRALKSEVESLLAEHDAGAEFLEAPPIELVGDGLADLSGRSIGPYRPIRLLGQGGMGAVYMAEQEKPIRRRVALKVLTAGWSGGDVAARFEAERQTLAMLDHPGVARVLDAGVTSAGRLYFVMDLVEGRPITEICRERSLSLEARVDLMIAVCEAVHHAHQKGIIHRDLKPANILVEAGGGEQQTDVMGSGSTLRPRIIDFGIAKLVGEAADPRAAVTEAGAMLGTLEYMSPEQAAGAAAGVDIRADVYALGMVLYEVLVGAPALDGRAMRTGGLAEMLRVLSERDPARPSDRLAALGGSAAAVRALRGDLDWIVMRAIEKDRERRYASALEMADDLRRHLAHLPVRARPPSTLYVLSRFVRRRRGVVVGIGAVIGSLAIGLGTALSLYNDARRAEDLANARYSGLLITITEISETSGTTLANINGGSVAAAAMAEAALERVRSLEARGDSDPPREQVLAYALQRVGECRMVMGRTAEALAHYEESLDVRMRSAAARPDDLVLRRSLGVGWLKVSEAQMRMGRAKDALQSNQHALATFESIDGRIGWTTTDRSVYLGRARRSIGEALAELGRKEEAMTSLRTALELYREGVADNGGNLVLARGHATTQRDIADTLAADEDLERARATYIEAIAAAAAVSARTGPTNVWERSGLALCHIGYSNLLVALKEQDAAAQEARDAIELAAALHHTDRAHAESHLLLVRAQMALAIALEESGPSEETQQIAATAAAAAQALTSADPANALASRSLEQAQELLTRIQRDRRAP
jgi:eukaryotic-like serine/threonine-protein kinase